MSRSNHSRCLFGCDQVWFSGILLNTVKALGWQPCYFVADIKDKWSKGFIYAHVLTLRRINRIDRWLLVSICIFVLEQILYVLCTSKPTMHERKRLNICKASIKFCAEILIRISSITTTRLQPNQKQQNKIFKKIPNLLNSPL